MNKISFYFDFLSPYAHIAFPMVKKVAQDFKYDLETIPVVFGALLTASGSLGPAEIPSKRTNLWKDIIRISSKENRKLKGPPFHPFSPLLPLRVCSTLEGEKQHQVIGKIFDSCWENGLDISNQETISKILKELKLNSEDILKQATSEDIKLKLKLQTEKAIEKGVFGVPTFIVNDQLFWGQDRIDHLIEYLQGNDPFHPNHPNYKENLLILEEMEKRPRGIDRKLKSKL